MTTDEQLPNLEWRLRRAEVAKRLAQGWAAEKDVELAEQVARVAALQAEIAQLQAVIARKDLEIRSFREATNGPGPANPAHVLREAARGRSQCLNDVPDDAACLLEVEIATIEACARVVDGDDGPLYVWLPLHLWSSEMQADPLARALFADDRRP